MYKKKKIGVLGSIALDNIFHAESIPQKGERVLGNFMGSCIGGMAANQAVEAARYSGDIYIMGSVGEDDVGQRISSYLTEKGCNIELLMKNPNAPTGQTYMFLVDGNNDYFSVVSFGANEAEVAERIIKKLDGLDALLISLEMNIDTVKKVMEYAKVHGIYTYLSLSPAEKCLPELINKADALIANQREARMLLGIQGDSPKEIMEELEKREFGKCGLCLISLGEHGAVLKEGENIYYAEGLKVNPVDPVGAGDAFTGAFVVNHEMGMESYKALCYGCIAGALTVSSVGAQASMHTPAGVEGIYQEHYT